MQGIVNVAVQPPGKLGTACTDREQLPADIRPHIAGGVFDRSQNAEYHRQGLRWPQGAVI